MVSLHQRQFPQSLCRFIMLTNLCIGGLSPSRLGHLTQYFSFKCHTFVPADILLDNFAFRKDVATLVPDFTNRTKSRENFFSRKKKVTIQNSIQHFFCSEPSIETACTPELHSTSLYQAAIALRYEHLCLSQLPP